MRKLLLSITVIAFMAGTVTTSFGQAPDKESVKARENLKQEKKDVVVAKQDLIVAQKDSVSDYQQLTKESNDKFKTNEKNIADLRSKIVINNSKDQAADQKRSAIWNRKTMTLKGTG
ncbi:MAG: hypothetical protein IPN67_11540 [Bacteroidales bacterium]|nr:hypothetical protein [Bacteroidales bacterium]